MKYVVTQSREKKLTEVVVSDAALSPTSLARTSDCGEEEMAETVPRGLVENLAQE